MLSVMHERYQNRSGIDANSGPHMALLSAAALTWSGSKFYLIGLDGSATRHAILSTEHERALDLRM